MFNPIERGRQLREQRQRDKVGCGFCGSADKPKERKLYQYVTHDFSFEDNLRTFADKPAGDANIATNGNTAEITRNLSALYPQPTKTTTTGFPANPQNPQWKKAEVTLKSEEATTAANVETMLDNLRIVGRDLSGVKELARTTMLQLRQKEAAELAAAMDDAFEVSPNTVTAVAQCRKLLTNPAALEAAKAMWPRLPPAPAPALNDLLAQAPPQQEPSPWDRHVPP
jgi:hypothetical protein